MRVLIVGSGAWATAITSICSRAGCNITVWGRNRSLIEELRRTRCHPGLEGNPRLDTGVAFVHAFENLSEFDVIILATSFQSLRSVLEKMVDAGLDFPGIACASKGIERGSLCFASDVVEQVLGTGVPFAQISGPNFAHEILGGKPSATAIGSSDPIFGQVVVSAMRSENFRPYYTRDIIGVQIGGALKNIIAIAVGISDGMGLGANAKAALITRGLAEITRFGMGLGAVPGTFMGMAGVGDLVLTCSDDQSRNRSYGLALAGLGGLTPSLQAPPPLVEGLYSVHAVIERAEKIGLEMPISQAVSDIVNGRQRPTDAVSELLRRAIPDEAS
jgi:glycerol-3-phosphate dehydrogenase (NAD(P)+)